MIIWTLFDHQWLSTFVQLWITTFLSLLRRHSLVLSFHGSRILGLVHITCRMKGARERWGGAERGNSATLRWWHPLTFSLHYFWWAWGEYHCLFVEDLLMRIVICFSPSWGYAIPQEAANWTCFTLIFWDGHLAFVVLQDVIKILSIMKSRSFWFSWSCWAGDRWQRHWR